MCYKLFLQFNASILATFVGGSEQWLNAVANHIALTCKAVASSVFLLVRVVLSLVK